MQLESYNNLGETKLESRLMQHIRNHDEYPIVVGAAYRFTNKTLMRALEGKKCVSILVQNPGWQKFKQDYNLIWLQYKQLLQAVPGVGNTSGFNFEGLTDAGFPYWNTEAIREIGQKETRTGTRQHYKFLVFCGIEEAPLVDPFAGTDWEGIVDSASMYSDHNRMRVIPKAVWTGSANFTQQGLNQNGETAIFTNNPEMVSQHYELWMSLFRGSRSIDELGQGVLGQFNQPQNDQKISQRHECYVAV